MKILWANCNFLHPTNKGGSIRTLGILKHLSCRHEIHYAAFELPGKPEGPARSGEYSRHSYPVAIHPPERRSLAFGLQLLRNLASPLPMAVERFRSEEMTRTLDALIQRESFDCLVVDHLPTAVFFPHLRESVLFQHNVETMIWERHAKNAPDPVRRRYFEMQAKRMLAFERSVCQTVRTNIAVSPVDADEMRKLFNISNVAEVPTGVDVEYYTPQGHSAPSTDFVFVGSMDWLPNIDAVTYFVKEVLPLIRRKRPDCTVAIVGRTPPPAIRRLAENDPRVIVTGTVPDVRPFLWGAAVSIVPIRVGGGTRLKVYESMAAKVAIVSTTIGAEGLDTRHPDNIRLADTTNDFAAHCLELLENEQERARVVENAWAMVNGLYSNDVVAGRFERILTAKETPRAAGARP